MSKAVEVYNRNGTIVTITYRKRLWWWQAVSVTIEDETYLPGAPSNLTFVDLGRRA